MQKLWLKNFEFHISPNTWNTAQDLVRDGAVRNLQEVEKHFWVASVLDSDDQRFEIEVIISPNKIKAFTCECWSEGRRLMCAHIAAALLKIRQFLAQQSEARQARFKADKAKESEKLTVQNVLEVAAEADLAAFVRDYAKRDRDFALALKTWFAGQITGAGNPFLLVFDSALPRHAGAQALKTPELRRLKKTLDKLEAQLETAALESNQLAVVQISTAILQKMIPLLAKQDDDKGAFMLKSCQLANRRLLQPNSDNLSPELREKRLQCYVELISEKTFPPELETPVVRFLAYAANADVFFEQIRQVFDQTPFPAPQHILNLFAAALAQRALPEAVVRVLQDYAEYPARVQQTLASLFDLQYREAVCLAGMDFLGTEESRTGYTRKIEEMTLLAAEKSGDTMRYKAVLQGLFQQTGSEDIYLRLKNLAGPDWPETREQLLRAQHNHTDPIRLATLLAADDDLEALIELLERQNDLALLRKFEKRLLPAYTGFVRAFYIQSLSEHLAEHFGRQGAISVRDELSGLLRSGQVELVKEIIVDLVARFPDRQALPEELAELFPVSKRAFVLPPVEP